MRTANKKTKSRKKWCPVGVSVRLEAGEVCIVKKGKPQYRQTECRIFLASHVVPCNIIVAKAAQRSLARL